MSRTGYKENAMSDAQARKKFADVLATEPELATYADRAARFAAR